MLPIGTALSGMRVSMARVTASASNIANVNSVGAVQPANAIGDRPQTQAQAPYTPIRAISRDQAAGGAIATYAPKNPAWVLRSDPGSSYADEDGMVAAPNVDLTDELVETKAATLAFAANAVVLRAADRMFQSTIERWG